MAITKEKVRKNESNECRQWCGETGALAPFRQKLAGMYEVWPLQKTALQKTEQNCHTTPKLHFQVIHERTEADLNRYPYTSVHCGIICRSQKVEISHLVIDG